MKLLILVACLILTFATAETKVNPVHTILKTACNYCAKRMCHAVFIQKRKYNTTRPYLPELTIYENVVDVTVNLQENYVETRGRIDKPIIISRAYFGSLGCIVDKKLPYKRKPSTYKETDLKKETNERIQQIINKQFENQSLNTRGIVVAVNGTIVGERYAPEFGPSTPQLGWSMTKSMINTLYGMRVKDGKINISDKLNAPEWNEPNDPRKEITINELLQMSSGLQFTESYANPFSDVVQMLYFVNGSLANYAATRGLKHKPSTYFYYSSGTSNILSRKLRETFATDEEYWNFPNTLFRKLGMSPGSIIETDAAGHFVGSSYGFLTPRDWLKFGLLYLQDGVWEGERILPPSWVRYTTTAAPASRGIYGSHWWLENETFSANGHEGQTVTIHPRTRTVIVRLGFSPNGWRKDQFVREITQAVAQKN
jgi:CubicO group peptidase (beta-lactamase class C family)